MNYDLTKHSTSCTSTVGSRLNYSVLGDIFTNRLRARHTTARNVALRNFILANEIRQALAHSGKSPLFGLTIRLRYKAVTGSSCACGHKEKRFSKLVSYVLIYRKIETEIFGSRIFSMHSIFTFVNKMRLTFHI